MLSTELEDKLHRAKLALNSAASENIIELCKQYLALLAEYRGELYKLPNTLDLRLKPSSSQEAIGVTREAIRAAIERTTHERERAEALILSFTAISGYGAIETLNRQRYKGRADWQLSAGGASFGDGAGDKRMTIQEAVETASLLRREEHVAKNAYVTGIRP